MTEENYNYRTSQILRKRKTENSRYPKISTKAGRF